MLTRVKKSRHISENEATSEDAYVNRRQILKSLGLVGVGAAGSTVLANSTAHAFTDPSDVYYPVPTNPKFTDGINPLTSEKDATTYNNFYEFGSSKSIARAAQKLDVRPWTIEINGLVDKPGTYDIDDILGSMPLEERVYRHRCVEAWAMTVPWSGFTLAALLKTVGPQTSASYVQFETFNDPKTAIGIKQSPWYPWPYTEGLTINEAMNDLTFMVTGLYGKPVPSQNGAPLRLAVPWKYGFKHIKSITRITLTDKQPVSFWEQLQKKEYGFWANVNPEVDHPRWSQATERDIGTGQRRPTLMFNGYGEEVAHLYKGLDQKYGNRLYR